MIRFSQIEAFRAVIVSGSTTAAARALNTSQPNVSRSISQLEKSTGLKLFHRSPGKIVPTQDGHSFYNEVQRSYVGLHRLGEAATRIRRFSGGVLRIAAIQTLAQGLVPRTILRFSQAHPEVVISVHSGHSSAVSQWVDEQFCDFGIVSSLNESYNFDQERLYEVDAVCLMPEDHKLAGKSLIVPADLSDEPYISFAPDDHGRSAVDRVFSEAGINRRITLETSYSSVVYPLVGLKLGVAIVNPIVAREFEHLPVVVRAFIPSVPHVATLIFSKGRPQTRLVTNFVELLKETADMEKFDLTLAVAQRIPGKHGGRTPVRLDKKRLIAKTRP